MVRMPGQFSRWRQAIRRGLRKRGYGRSFIGPREKRISGWPDTGEQWAGQDLPGPRSSSREPLGARPVTREHVLVRPARRVDLQLPAWARTMAIQVAAAAILVVLVLGVLRLPGRAGASAGSVIRRYGTSDFDFTGTWRAIWSLPWVQQVMSATGLDAYLGGFASRNSGDEGPGGEVATLQQRRFKMPVQGTITSSFGWVADPTTGVRTYHSGIDISAPEGTVVTAALDGRVTKVAEEPGYGKMVIVDHGSGVTTWYAHLSAVSVKERQYVKQGAEVGKVGQTGTATGPHLHFEIRVGGNAVDPQLYLPASTQ